jgi:hypothetical protein
MPGVRLRTLADVFAYAQTQSVELRLDGTETQVRRPQAKRAGRRAFISGKKKQNAIKATTHLRRAGPHAVGRGPSGRVGCMARPRSRPRDRGAVAPAPQRHRRGRCRLSGAKAFGGQVHAPPHKPNKDAPAEELAAWQAARKQQSSERICVEHANAEHKQWPRCTARHPARLAARNPRPPAWWPRSGRRPAAVRRRS